MPPLLRGYCRQQLLKLLVIEVFDCSGQVARQDRPRR